MTLPFSLLLVPLLSITVCKTCEISSIGAAIAAAKPGDSVEVQAGEYTESELTIDKPLHLIGQGMPVIDGDGKADVLRVLGKEGKASGVEISGFEIRHSGKSYVTEYAGIKVEDVTSCVIRGNKLLNNNYGIYLANTSGCTVEKNNLSGVISTEADTGNGIHIWQGHDHKIVDNVVSGQRDGIYFEFVTDSLIEGNHSCDNLRYGLHFMFSHRDRYLQNEFCRNGAGVAVMYSRDIEMVENKFTYNQGPAAYGLLLKDIGGAKISANDFSYNSIGVHMEGSNRGKFRNNQFSNNGKALRIFGDCDSNEFVANNFKANTFDVSTNSDSNPNLFSGNYWSQYDGYDLSHDGEGDRPFRLVSLSSIIMERVDASYSLLRSPLLMLLDQIERALPELIPARMEDEKPQMNPIDFASPQRHSTDSASPSV